ncbi:MAG: hypothetical protein ACR2L1_09260 [Pyrinomonadaceae bacterium]
MKICITCQQEKTEICFSRKGSSLQSSCKIYYANSHRQYYEKNREKYFAKNRLNKNRQRARLRVIILAAKQKPCQDCERKYHPWVMEFDHREGTDRIEAVGNLAARGCTDEKLKSEIEKCDVVCTNCHRMRTFNRHQAKAILKS